MRIHHAALRLRSFPRRMISDAQAITALARPRATAAPVHLDFTKIS